MICPKCKKQIPDDANDCGYCGAEINHQEQVSKEISFRRYQRWFFYALIAFIILGMILVIVRIYNANSENLARLATMEEKVSEQEEKLEETEEELGRYEDQLSEKEREVQEAEGTLTQLEQELQEKQVELTEKEEELQEKTRKLQEELDARTEIRQEYEECHLNVEEINPVDANLFNMIVQLGKGVSSERLSQMWLADVDYPGQDTSGNGLPDIMERALGTDPSKADTSGNGYDDKTEYINGYNPLGEGKLETDWDFVNENKGKILLQVEDEGQAWYLDHNGRRHFLGHPTLAFETLNNFNHCWDDYHDYDEEEEEWDEYEEEMREMEEGSFEFSF